MSLGCKRPGGVATITGASSTVRTRFIIHPRRCMGARSEHLDIPISEDPCGLREFLRRGGHKVAARHMHNLMVILLDDLLGYPCSIELHDPPSSMEKCKRFYIMLTKSGNLYVSCSEKGKN
jgi:hypothetical protein